MMSRLWLRRERSTAVGHWSALAIALSAGVVAGSAGLRALQTGRPVSPGAEVPVEVIATPDQHHLRPCAVSLQQVHEVGILGHHHDSRAASGSEDLEVRRALQPQMSDRLASDGERRSHPGGKGGRELVIEPDCHAATIGWSRRRLANRRQALMSSISRSGSSSITCAADRPEASRSSTSVTRMRNPRTQGRPPLWSGFTVIRSATAGTVEPRSRICRGFRARRGNRPGPSHSRARQAPRG